MLLSDSAMPLKILEVKLNTKKRALLVTYRSKLIEKAIRTSPTPCLEFTVESTPSIRALFLPILSRYFEIKGDTNSEAAGIAEKIAPSTM